jgi:TolB-like protein
MTLAVTDFPDRRKQICGLGQFVAERLSTLLSRQPHCRLIERRRLDLVLNELKFSMSELVDPAKAQNVGQMLDVQGLVIGTISDVASTLDVDARIIDIQTAASLPGASCSIIKDETVRELASPVRAVTSTRESDQVPVGEGSQPSAPASPGASQPPVIAAPPTYAKESTQTPLDGGYQPRAPASPRAAQPILNTAYSGDFRFDISSVLTFGLKFHVSAHILRNCK